MTSRKGKTLQIQYIYYLCTQARLTWKEESLFFIFYLLKPFELNFDFQISPRSEDLYFDY